MTFIDKNSVDYMIGQSKFLNKETKKITSQTDVCYG